MPTPVGHALGGLAFGWLIAGAGPTADGSSVPQQLRQSWRRAVVFAGFGAFADIDLLFHAHSTYTHSVGAAMLAGLVALACGAAYGSHVLLDWLGVDNSPPLGVTALWPFSSAWYYSGVDLFPAVDRRYWLPGFVMQDAKALAVELIVLVPFTAFVLWLRRKRYA